MTVLEVCTGFFRPGQSSVEPGPFGPPLAIWENQAHPALIFKVNGRS